MTNLKSASSTSWKFLFLILAFFLTLNFATSGGHLYSIDDSQYFLHTENLFFNKSLELDPFSPSAKSIFTEEFLKELQLQNLYYPGKIHFEVSLDDPAFQDLKQKWKNENPLEPFYSRAPLLLSFVSIPLYYISHVTSSDPITILSFFTNSIILSLISFVIFLTSMHYFNSKKISFILSLVFLVTTWVWSYNTGMMVRPLVALLVILGFYFIVTSKTNSSYRPLISGMCFGLAILTSFSVLIIIPGLAIFGIYNFRKNRKSIFLFLGSIFILLFTQALLNEARFESYTNFGLGELADPTIHLKNYEGVIGYIFSLGWGVFFNAPLLILFPVATYFVMKKNRSLGFLLSYLFIVTWLFHGTGPAIYWSGYGGWGPRYFTIILPLLILSLGFILEKYSSQKIFKLGFAGLAIIGFFVSFVGKLVWYWYGYHYGWTVLGTSSDTVKGWLLQNYNISQAPITQNLLALFSNHIQNVSIPYELNFARGLAPCQFDYFIYCNFGILPLLIILLSLCFMGFLILKNLRKELPQSTVEVI